MSVPIGAVIPIGSTGVPWNFLPIRGQPVSMVAYPELFAVIGTSFNTPAPPVGEFRLPSGADRGIRDLNSTDSNLDAAAGSGVVGTATQTLGLTNIPQHTHPEAFGGGSGGYGSVNDGPAVSNSTSGGAWGINMRPLNGPVKQQTSGAATTTNQPFSILNPQLSLKYMIRYI